MVACVAEEKRHKIGVEVPEWMFDRTVCSQLRKEEEPWVCLEALVELKNLLEHAKCNFEDFSIKHQHLIKKEHGGADASSEKTPVFRTNESISSATECASLGRDSSCSPTNSDRITIQKASENISFLPGSDKPLSNKTLAKSSIALAQEQSPITIWSPLVDLTRLGIFFTFY